MTLISDILKWVGGCEEEKENGKRELGYKVTNVNPPPGRNTKRGKPQASSQNQQGAKGLIGAFS